MKFLIIQTAFLGDVVLATPLIEKLRHFYPAAEIDFLCRKGNEGLLAGHPHLRKVLVWNKKSEKLRNGWRILQHIRAEKYDWVFNCQRFLSSGILTVFSCAKWTAGFDKNPLSIFFSKKIKHRFGTDDAPIHETERNLELVKHLTDGSFFKPKLYPSAADFDFLKKKFPKLNEPFLTIAPTSVWFTKQFPGEKWVEFLKILPENLPVFLLGAPSDFEDCEKIRLAAGKTSVENWSGKLSFLQSAALMSLAKMNYVNDSAPMHLASAMNAPVTAVFCSTVPAFGFTPLSDVRFVFEVSEKLDCRPCGLHGFQACPKGHFRCAYNIGVELLTMNYER